MARLEWISNTKWKQYFRDRNKEIELWKSHGAVANFCRFRDGQKRRLRIEFEKRFDLVEEGWFLITNSKEVRFPKNFQNKIRDIVFQNKDSYFTVEVVDEVENLDLTEEQHAMS